jgi:hypothetical protein
MMDSLTLRLAAVFLAPLLLFPQAGLGQDYDYGFNAASDSMYNYLGTEIMNGALDSYIDGSSGEGDGGEGGKPDAPIVVENTRYTPQSTIEKEVKDIIIASALPNAKDPAAVTQLVTNGDVESFFTQLMTPHGLKAGDLSDALTAYWLTMWTIVNDKPMPSPDVVSGVRAQFEAVLRTDGNMAEEGSRQRMAQIYSWQMIFAVSYHRLPGMDKVALGQELDRIGKENGFELRRMEPTVDGFVVR